MLAEISSSSPRRLNTTSLYLFIAPMLNDFECAKYIGENSNCGAEPSTAALTTFSSAHCSRFHRLNWLITDPKQPTIKKNRNFWQTTFVRTENEQSIYRTWPSRLVVCISLRNSASSRPIWRISASRPAYSRNRHFW